VRRPSKSQFWIIVVGLVLQVLVPLTKHIPGAAGLWHTEDPAKFYSAFATFFGIQLVLMSGTLLLLVKSLGNELTDRVTDALPMTKVRQLKDYQFYEHFQAATEQAEHSVRIAYLAPYPPMDVPIKGRKKYYDAMLSLMKERSKVNFKRIVRESPKNDRWIADLIRELANRPNVDLAVLTRDLPPEDELPLTLSVQLIDKDKVWIVAAGSHETQSEFRDVFIQSEELAVAMEQYYDRIWSISEKLLDRGRPTLAAQRFLSGEK
jgi:hypothetical protein